MIETTPFRCFKCSKNYENDLTFGEYLRHNEPYSNYEEKRRINKYSFFGRTYNESVWLSDVYDLINLARKGIKQLEQASLKNDSSVQQVNYLEIRHCVVELFLVARFTISKYQIKTDLLTKLNDVVENLPLLREMPDYVLFNSVKNVDERFNAPFNLVHLYLDLKWISLTFEDGSGDKESAIISVLKDLIYVGVKKFERNSDDPFLCSCFKEMWLLVQLLIENSNGEDFWTLFNKNIKETLRFEATADGRNAFCCMWLLQSVAKVHGFDKKGTWNERSLRIVPNYSLVDDCLKSLLQSSCDELRLRQTLHFVTFFQTKWWRDAYFDLLQLLWEHFYKRIQTSFATNESKSFTNQQKFVNFVEVIDNLLQSDQTSSTSYEIFLHLLSFYLKRNPSSWSKLKGRIYSKLSASKLAQFNDTGLQNLISLLLILAYSVNFNELTEKLLALLNQMPLNRCEDNAIIWSAQLSMILIHLKRDMPIGNIGSALLNLVEGASVNRSRAQLMKLFVEGLGMIEESSNNLQCGQHILFASSWIKSYLQWCPLSEACVLLDLLTKLIEQLKYQGLTREWITTIDLHIVPPLVNLAMGTDAPGQVTKLAATIVAMDSKKYAQLVEQLTGDNVNVENVEKFIRYLIEKADLHQLVFHQTLLIQAWVKINMLSQSERHLNDITLTISKFPEWTQTFGSFDVTRTEDILYDVIKLAGNRVREARNITEVASMKRWFELYFGKMDTWVQNILNTLGSDKLLIRIYTYGALLFIHCCSALYTKNKTSNLLYRLVSTMLLPSSILMNKKPPENLIAALRLTWHLFIRGLVQLDYANDPYIERILKDIIIRYVPHLCDSGSPIIRCLDSEFKDKDTVFIVDKICTLIAYRSRSVNEFAQQALSLILEMLLAKKDVGKLKILIEKALPSILELVMFVENFTYKKIITNIFYALIKHQYYKDLKEIVIRSVLVIVEKHLAFYTQSVFQMLEFLTKVFKTEILEIVPQLKGLIEKVEKMRGVGYDNTLRKGLQDIQELSKKV